MRTSTQKKQRDLDERKESLTISIDQIPQVQGWLSAEALHSKYSLSKSLCSDSEWWDSHSVIYKSGSFGTTLSQRNTTKLLNLPPVHTAELGSFPT